VLKRSSSMLPAIFKVAYDQVEDCNTNSPASSVAPGYCRVDYILVDIGGITMLRIMKLNSLRIHPPGRLAFTTTVLYPADVRCRASRLRQMPLCYEVEKVYILRGMSLQLSASLPHRVTSHHRPGPEESPS
jgi:hypothetical protein